MDSAGQQRSQDFHTSAEAVDCVLVSCELPALPMFVRKMMAVRVIQPTCRRSPDTAPDQVVCACADSAQPCETGRLAV